MFTTLFEIVNGRQFGPHLGRHELFVVFVIHFVFRFFGARFASFVSRRWFGTDPWLVFSLNDKESSWNECISMSYEKLEEGERIMPMKWTFDFPE